MGNPPASQPLSGRTSHVRWNILALLVLLSFVAYLLRTNMSIAGVRMMGDLGLSQMQLGWILAAFAWGYAIFQFPGGLLGEWLGGRKALTIIAVLWGLLNLLVALVPGSAAGGPLIIIGTLAALRFLMGAAQAPVFPVLSGHTIARWFPVSGWAFPNGLTNMGLTLGAAATGPLIAWLILAFGWRGSFVLMAPLAFLCAGIWWWHGRDDPSQHRAVNPEELALALAWSRQSELAAVEARRGIDLDPTAFYPNWTLLHALALGPIPAEAVELGPSILSRFGRHPWLMMGLALANGALGRREKADALYAELVARSRGEYVQPAALMAAALGAGRRVDLIRHFEEATEVRDPLLALMAPQWPGYDALRSDGDFVAVLRRLRWDRPMQTGKLEGSVA